MGELARKPGAPTFADSPMELLSRPGKGFTTFDYYVAPVMGFLAGALMNPVANKMSKRPWFAGMHFTILLGPVGYYLGSLFRDWRFNELAEKDAVMIHYISLHPEDFPPYEKKRFKDLFLPWTPIR